MTIVITGPAGAGKTTIGTRVAERLEWRFIEGDDHHPEANIRKMSRGVPLTDEDRRPWLQRLRRLLEDSVEADESVVLACSALKAAYRDFLKAGLEDIAFVRLEASKDVLRERLRTRKGHFAGEELLESQLSSLEDGTELLIMDAHRPADELAAEIIDVLELERGA